LNTKLNIQGTYVLRKRKLNQHNLKSAQNTLHTHFTHLCQRLVSMSDYGSVLSYFGMTPHIQCTNVSSMTQGSDIYGPLVLLHTTLLWKSSRRYWRLIWRH